MKILAIDTSSTSGSIALVDNGAVVAERTVLDAGPHAVWLLDGLRGLLEVAGRSLEEIDLFAVAVGPGSFTGLRIGVSAVKGLAWALKKDVAGVSTLKAMAMNHRSSGMTICPVLDARKGEVYAALYRFDGGKATAVLADSAVAPEALYKKIEELNDGPLMFTGAGLSVCGDFIKDRFKGASFAAIGERHVRASNIALIASEGPDAVIGPERLSPVYLRKSEVELKSAKDAGRP